VTEGVGLGLGVANWNPKTAELKAEHRPKGDRGEETEGDGKSCSCTGRKSLKTLELHAKK